MPLENEPNVKPDVERRLVGYLLADLDRMAELSTRVELAYFALPETQAIYEAAEDLWLEGSLERDALETYLDEEGEIRSIGGADRLDELARKVQNDADDASFGLDYYCQLLKRAHKLRQVKDLAQRLSQVTTSQAGVERRWEEAEAIITNLLDPLARDSETVFTTEDLRTIGRERYNSNEDQMMPTGFMSLDKEIGGEPIGRVNVDAAITSHGKTSFGLQKALHIAKRLEDEEGQVLLISSELPEDSIERRLTSALSGISAHRIKKKELKEKELLQYMEAQDRLAELPITVDTNSSPTTKYLKGRMQIENAKEPVKFLIFDYLLWSGERSDNESIRLRKAISGLHEIAKEYHIPVTALKQISREGARRGKAPTLMDMQWSSSVEQLAGMVKILYWPWRAAEQGLGDGDPKEEQPEHYEVHVRKYADGPTGAIPLHINRRTMTFSDPEEESYRNNGQDEPLADETLGESDMPF